MVDVSTPEWNNCHERSVDLNTHGLCDSGDDNFFRVPLTENHEASKIEFGVGTHCFAHILGGVVGVCWKLDVSNPCFATSVYTKVSNLARVDPAKDARRVAGDN